MAKKKKVARPSKDSHPSRRTKTEPSKLAVHKKQDCTESITVRPDPLSIEHRETISFSIILNNIANFFVDDVRFIPNEGEPVAVRIPGIWYAPTSNTSDDAVDIFSYLPAKVRSTDGSLRGIASGKLTITIRPPNTIDGEQPSTTYEYCNVNFIPG